MTDIQEVVERSFFEAIRVKLVADGYTPDIVTFPTDEAGYIAYKAALAAIKTNKGFVVEVFGTSNPQSRGLKDIPRITLQCEAFLPGEIGFDPTPTPVLNPETNKYELYKYDRLSYDFMLDCRVSAENQAQLRYMMDVVHQSVPLLGYLKEYNSEEVFLVELAAFQDTTRPADMALDYSYRYVVPDLQWRKPIQAEPIAGIAPISTITLNLKLAERLGISATISGQ